MSKMKKLVGVMLAAMMVCAMSVAVLAANDGTITVSNATSGETYGIYKMLDLTYDSNSGSYAYTVATGWENFFAAGGDGADYVTVNNTTGAVTWNDSTITDSADLAAAAIAYAATNSLTATTQVAASSTVTFTGLSYGYYLVESSLGAVCSIDSTDPNASVRDKNGTTIIIKEVQEDSTSAWGEKNTADIGQDVSFRSTISDAYGVKNVVLHDVMSSGLTLNNSSFKITVGGTAVDTKYYTITTDTSSLSDGCTFEISFISEYTTTVLTSGQQIVVEYTATVNENAVIGGTGNPNETWVKYGNASESTHDKTTTYVYQIYIYKYTVKSGTETALAGAEFVLCKTENAKTYYAILDSDNKVSSWTETKADATRVTSGSNGLIQIVGLDADTYHLEETTAPTGYSLLADPVEIVINEDGTVTGATTVTIQSVDYSAIKVENSSGTELPSTGGIGTTIFYVAGTILALGAAILLVVKVRMKKA